MFWVLSGEEEVGGRRTEEAEEGGDGGGGKWKAARRGEMEIRRELYGRDGVHLNAIGQGVLRQIFEWQ